jgi:hypothetical protein
LNHLAEILAYKHCFFDLATHRERWTGKRECLPARFDFLVSERCSTRIFVSLHIVAQTFKILYILSQKRFGQFCKDLEYPGCFTQDLRFMD